MKIWHWLVVGIGTFIFGFVFGCLFVGPYRIVEKYEVFRDISAFVLAFSALGIAIFGVVVYSLISQGLDRKIEKKIKEETDSVLCRFYIELSYVYWKHYEKVIYKIDQEIKESDIPYLNLAIEQSEYAVERVEGLNEKRFGRFICLAKNNLAYHLAMRGFSDDARRAIPLAKYAYDKVWDFGYRENCGWVETYAFVLMKLGDEEQKKEGIEIIKGILKRDDLPDALRDLIKKKYESLKKLLDRPGRPGN